MREKSRGSAGAQARLQNVSVRGFCFETAIRFDPGDIIDFRMDVPGGRAVSGKARVRWAEPDKFDQSCLYGAAIKSMGWADASRLRKYLEPYSFNLLWSLDMLLKAACCLVLVLVTGDILQVEFSAGGLRGMFEYLPQVLVVGFLFVIFGFFKRTV